MSEVEQRLTNGHAMWRMIGVAATAVIVQFTLILARMDDVPALSWNPLVITVILAIGLFVGFIILSQRRPRPLLELIIVTISIGGLGMLLGGMLDATLTVPTDDPTLATLPPCHRELLVESAPAPSTTALLTWMNAAMIVACVLGCTLLCEGCRCASRWAAWGVHVLVTIGMIIGMPVGAWLLGPSLVERLGAALGAHVAMVVGMAGGVGLSWPLARLLRRNVYITETQS